MQPFSQSVALIEMRRGELCGATGSAFFYRQDEELFLVTNWHNVTGINATTNQPLHTGGMLPTSLRIHYKKYIRDTSSTMVGSAYADVSLYSQNGSPAWLEHSLRQRVDVVALKLDVSLFESWANRPINDVEQETRLSPVAGMDCFILGFPEGLIGPARTPIWKRGSIAIEIIPDKIFYYVDSATRKGMSGAPIIGRHSGILNFGAELSNDSIIGTVDRFIGIYSGRVGDDSLGYQLGIAWKSDVLEDIFSVRTSGFSPLDALS